MLNCLYRNFISILHWIEAILDALPNFSLLHTVIHQLERTAGFWFLCLKFLNYAWTFISKSFFFGIVYHIVCRPPLPFQLFELMKNVPNCSFASNPCRIQYTNQEIVVMRYDLVEKMCRNSIHMPSITADIAEHVKIFFNLCFRTNSYFFIIRLDLNVKNISFYA